MKKTTQACLAISFLFVLSTVHAEDKKPDAKVRSQMTTADAKKKCKDEGKEGKNLIDCIKEKKGDK